MHFVCRLAQSSSCDLGSYLADFFLKGRVVWRHTCPISLGWWGFLGLCGVVRDMKTKKPNDVSIGSTLLGFLLIIFFLLVIGMGLLLKIGIVWSETVMRKLFRQWLRRLLTLPSNQVILGFLDRAEHRTDAFPSVWVEQYTDTRSCCWILRGGFYRGVIGTNYPNWWDVLF